MRRLLSEVVDRFTEGQDTADLRAAPTQLSLTGPALRRLSSNAARTPSPANGTPAVSDGTRVHLPVNATDGAHLRRHRRPRVLIMSEKNVRFPANRAFVIQLRASSEEAELGHRGRVEHLASGQATRFADEDELWAFVDSVLATECPERREPQG